MEQPPIAKLEDTWGASVVVRESPVDSHGKLWLFVYGGLIFHNCGVTHLDAEQAAAVRDAIDVWLKDRHERRVA